MSSYLTGLTRLIICYICFSILVPIVCCQRRTIAFLKGEEKLLLIKYVPLGISYEELKKIFPEVSDMGPEGGIKGFDKWGLFEASAPISILDKKAKIEFNFKYNKLYSYYFWLEKLDCQTARKVYQELQKFYSDHYGKYQEEEESEPGYSSRSCFWYHGDFNFNMTNNIYPDGCVVAWGYQ